MRYLPVFVSEFYIHHFIFNVYINIALNLLHTQRRQFPI